MLELRLLLDSAAGSEASRIETIVGSSESLARLARLRGFLVLSLARLSLFSLARLFEALAFAVWL